MEATILVESKSINRLSQTKRILYYYNYLNKKETVDFKNYWGQFEKVVQAQQEYMIDFVLFISDKKDGQSINEADIEKAYVEANKSRKISKDELSVLKISWKKVKEIIQHEIQWEKKTFAYLNSVADKCPPISRAIVGILFSILLGLLTNCIYDGITMDDYSTGSKTNFISIHNSNVILLEENDSYYKAIYFTPDGDIEEEYVPKEEVTIVSE